MKNTKKKTHLKPSLTKGIVILSIILSIAISSVGLLLYSIGVIRGRKEFMSGMENAASTHIYADELRNCIDSNKVNSKFYDTQEFFNYIMDNNDLTHIYLLKPLNFGEYQNMMYLISGISKMQAEEGVKNVTFKSLSFDEYDAKKIKYYDDVMTGKKDVNYYLDKSSAEWKYVRISPVMAEDGTIICCLDMGISFDIIKKSISVYVAIVTIFTVVFVLVSVILINNWLDRRVISPIDELEKKAAEFSTICKDNDSLDEMVIERIVLNKNDELQSLSDSLFEMAQETKQYFARLVVEKNEKQAQTEANESKTRFLFNMSHDIRTPMNAISGYTLMAQESIDNPERVKECLNKIDSAGKHLVQLINDVLDMSRIENDKVEIASAPFDLFDGSLVDICDELANENGVKLIVNHSAVVDNIVMTDSLHLKQIIMNVLSNAVKYTPEGGTVTYRIIQKHSEVPNSSLYRFIIEDTGIGMSEEFQQHIFDSFSREQNTTDSGVQGTGLGMAIVKKLVDLMGGTIKIESEELKGTKVLIEFTFEHANATEVVKEVPKEPEKIDFTGKRLLLVEDNIMNREIARDILSHKGFIVEVAEDGDIAVEKMAKVDTNYYDCILMDIQMPNMNGYDATRNIRALDNNRFKDIPIIAMTANAFEEDKKHAYEAGMNAHLSKPINIAVVMKTLAEFIK